MENRYKVELWIKEKEDLVLSSNLIDFKTSDDNSLRIVSNQYEDIFSYLSEDNPVKIVNLDLTNKTIYKAIEEYLYSTSEDKRSLMFSTINKTNQLNILHNLKKNDEQTYQKHTTHSLYITFGLLDYYDQEKRHEIKSAPLVFMPISLQYNEEKNTYKVRQINKELYLNDVLISFLRKSKKIDISYPINENFSIVEYLNFVASKVHLLHYSVNNGTFISNFNLNNQSYLEDLINNQEQIVNTTLVKSISYYNSEFYSFSGPRYQTLNKKLLTLLPLDNEEYRILQNVSNRDSLFIRCDSDTNRIHLFNSILSSLLINNKKTLIVYDSKTERDLFVNNLDPILNSYFTELNKTDTNKDLLLNRLDLFDINHLSKEVYDPITTQDIISSYYKIKNDFKKTINALRKKEELFSLSINDAVDQYYKLNNQMVDIEIPYINEITPNQLDDYLSTVRDFSISLKNLKCPYKDHPFYGFSKSSMMQEEYLPLKDASLSLSSDLTKIINCIKTYSQEFNLPIVYNLKTTKALLNIFSVLDLYKDYDSNLFLKESWNEYYDKISEIARIRNKSSILRNEMITTYGESIFNIPTSYKDRLLKKKHLSKKEIKELSLYITNNIDIHLETLVEIFDKFDSIEILTLKEEAAINAIPLCFKPYLNRVDFSVSSLKIIEDASSAIYKSIEYLTQNKIVFSLDILNELKKNNSIDELLEKRKKLQFYFNNILKNTNTIQEFFDESIFDFSTLDYQEYLLKMDSIDKNFISINDYLDFLLSLWKTNKVIKGLGSALLKESDYTLYEAMLCKRFYYDYALYIINSNCKNLSSSTLINSIENYDTCEGNRKLLFDSIVRNYYVDYLRSNLATLKRFEKNYLEEEKNSTRFVPLSKITSLAHESIYHRIPLLMVPLKELSSTLSSNQYHFDTIILLSDRNIKTKDTLSCLYRGDQIIVFDDKLITNSPHEDFIDPFDVETFVSAAKRTYKNVDFVATTFNSIPLQINKKDINFKKYLYTYLLNNGFSVASNVTIEDISVDFVVRLPNRLGMTAITINRFPYYSIESAKVSLLENEEKLTKHGYFFLNIFPFAVFKDEENELNRIKNILLNNSEKTPHRKTKIVKRKLSDILFDTYKTPRELYHTLDHKNNFTRKELFYKIISRR